MSQVIGNVCVHELITSDDSLTKFFIQTALAYHRAWHHVDARGRTLGKLAQRIAIVLMGKHKPTFDRGGRCITPHLVSEWLNIVKYSRLWRLRYRYKC